MKSSVGNYRKICRRNCCSRKELCNNLPLLTPLRLGLVVCINLCESAVHECGSLAFIGNKRTGHASDTFQATKQVKPGLSILRRGNKTIHCPGMNATEITDMIPFILKIHRLCIAKVAKKV